MKKIKLVLSGSGTLYPLHVGAVNCLHRAGYEIEAITGVSGGSIVAAALASGYQPGKELTDLVLDNLPGPNKLIDYTLCPLWHWGLIKGDRLHAKFSELMPTSLEETTIPLRVVAVNIDEKGNYDDPIYTVFGTEETPEISVADAVRASISIPGIFRPVNIGGHRYVDGGVAASFPLDIYGEGKDVIGLHVRGNRNYANPNGIIDYVRAIIQIMLESVNREYVEDATWARTIVLRSPTTALNLYMARDEAEHLIEIGYRQAEDQLRAIET